MIRRPADVGGIHALKAQFPQIERIDEGINHANRIALIDPVLEAFRQQRRLPSIHPRNEPRHRSPRRLSSRIIAGARFSHSQGHERSFGEWYSARLAGSTTILPGNTGFTSSLT